MQNVTESTPASARITHRNDGTLLDFDVVFDLYMASEEKQKAWEHDRSKTVGASEVWACLRQVWYDKRGAEFGFEPDESDENWGAMERGNLIENHYVVPGLRLALPKMKTLPEGVELLLAGSDQKTIVLGKNSATPDGVIKGLTPGPLTIKGGKQEIYIPDIGADCIVLEIKSIDPRATLLEEKDRHHGQTQVQLGLIREMTKYKPRFAVVLYIDASFLTVTPFVIEFDEAAYAVAKQRALDVYRINDPLMIMPEGRFVGACAECKWRAPCGSAVIDSMAAKGVTTQDPRAIAETDPLVHDYLIAKKAYDDAEIRVAVSKEAIKESLLDHKVSTLTGANWRVSWFPVKGRKTLDQKRLAEDFDLAPYMKEGLPHEQLRVTEHLPDTAEKKTRKKKGT